MNTTQIQIHSISELLRLQAGTVLKLLADGSNVPEYRVIQRAQLTRYSNDESGVPCDREVLANGVHQVGPVFESDFESGTKVFLATKEEAHGRKFSYGTQAREPEF